MEAKIIEGVKITKQIERLFDEAKRRYIQFASRDHEPIDEAWLGLGTPSAYRQVVKAGLMVPIHSDPYLPRINHWYVFTEKGLKVFAAWQALTF